MVGSWISGENGQEKHGHKKGFLGHIIILKKSLTVWMGTIKKSYLLSAVQQFLLWMVLYYPNLY
jgi:hypothetical protein